MSDRADWQPLRDELRRWSEAGRKVKFWFRDDDAIEPTPALDRLLSLANRFDVPMALAIIPGPTGEALAERLKRESHITATVHGWTHQNYAPEETKKQELGLHRPQSIVLDELHRGFDKLKTLYPQQFVPLLVPPWNRIDDALLPHLAPFGYRAVSVFGLAKQAPIGLINTHIDIMRWHGVRGGLPHAEVIGRLVEELRIRFDGHDEPIGVMTHHLAHDDLAWDFVETLFRETADHAAIEWRPINHFIH
ncbi:polysaccharide deacetylase family protein [Rhizobium sp. CNPSo 4039]|uniref:polysaccharide deacetylase family protein n=1 Tax=Rhizobium sp. CNPSo 4039 TaxID=3021409 RepID=UPI00254B941B|nr:polysaccharide deacetylase family protein [Rhizobium sp. CNPSo 4039]MDK4712289.1 polysaccharide deacetylase family protein [Rhizobium sp. CNPSo 4039]